MHGELERRGRAQEREKNDVMFLSASKSQLRRALPPRAQQGGYIADKCGVANSYRTHRLIDLPVMPWCQVGSLAMTSVSLSAHGVRNDQLRVWRQPRQQFS